MRVVLLVVVLAFGFVSLGGCSSDTAPPAGSKDKGAPPPEDSGADKGGVKSPRFPKPPK